MYGRPTWVKFEKAFTQASENKRAPQPGQAEARAQLEAIDWRRISAPVTTPAQLHAVSRGPYGSLLAEKLWNAIEHTKAVIRNKEARPRQALLGAFAIGKRDVPPPDLTARFVTGLRFQDVQAVQQLLSAAQLPYDNPHLKLHQITWFEPEERLQAVAGTVKLQPDGAPYIAEPPLVAGYMWAGGFAWFDDSPGMTYSSTELVIFTAPSLSRHSLRTQ